MLYRQSRDRPVPRESNRHLLSIASITEIETGRTGYTKTIQVPLTAHNCLVLGNAAEIHSPEMFNQQVHTARIEADGCTIIEGVPMISRCGQDADGSAWCQINIIGAGKEWVKLPQNKCSTKLKSPSKPPSAPLPSTKVGAGTILSDSSRYNGIGLRCPQQPFNKVSAC